LLKAYNNGLGGAVCDPEETAKLLGDLKHPNFAASAYGLYGSGEGKLSLPFKALLKFDPGFGPSEAQKTGDCVSHATRNAVDVTRAWEIHAGDSEEFVTRTATEGIYGSRGHGGQGMHCSQAAKFVHDRGGILLRKKYSFADLSKYNANYGIDWGRRGLPRDLTKEAKKHQVQTISLVGSVDAARDAIANGYAISVCSGYGFSSRRDKYGICKHTTSWSHAMAWIGCDDTHERYKETLFLVQNSWGKWNSGPKVHGQPDGSFWIRERDAIKMLNANGAWVFSNVNGFPSREVNWTVGSQF
jgi:hypothetical protein